MKKNLFTTMSSLLIAISAFAYSGGNGTEQNPYLISSRADMEQLASNVNNGQTYSGAYFKLTRDLTEASDTVTTVIGNSDSYYFSGIFDGNGHKIAVKEKGIFGKIQNATINNLEVCGRIISYSYSRSSISSSPFSTFREGNFAYYNYYHNYNYHYTGAICAYTNESNITNCKNSAEIESLYSFDYDSCINNKCLL
jgi:hypothetical protein